MGALQDVSDYKNRHCNIVIRTNQNYNLDIILSYWNVPRIQNRMLFSNFNIRNIIEHFSDLTSLNGN